MAERTVTVDGVEIGGVRIQSVAEQMFGRDGKISEIEYASSFIASLFFKRHFVYQIIFNFCYFL